MSLDLIYAITDGAMMVAAFLVATFVISYSILFDPTKTLAGRLVRKMMIGLFGVMVVGLVHDVFQQEAGWAIFRLAVWVYCCLVFALLVWLVFARRFQVRERKIVPVPDPIDPLQPSDEDSGSRRSRKL